MHCYVHEQKEAVAACVHCGKFICEECRTEINGKNYCKNCVSEVIAEQNKKIDSLEAKNAAAPTVYVNAGNTSGSYTAPAVDPRYVIRPKSKIAAGLLGIFLGGLGVHKFYLGRIGLGFVYLIFCWTGIPWIIGFIEGIIYLCMTDEEFLRKYCTAMYS